MSLSPHLGERSSSQRRFPTLSLFQPSEAGRIIVEKVQMEAKVAVMARANYETSSGLEMTASDVRLMILLASRIRSPRLVTCYLSLNERLASLIGLLLHLFYGKNPILQIAKSKRF